eukprot:TRINITY_DN787_c0_g1_i1.p1 TRINITY_DN787_c0_g1~~TRINITY_DN787_c0_g1_i1.p1  ORF type:complete len:168 (-),score=55.82 TRINITY_DN787_c0_g1_i1:76-579(-)
MRKELKFVEDDCSFFSFPDKFNVDANKGGTKVDLKFKKIDNNNEHGMIVLDSGVKTRPKHIETDKRRISQRQRQINIGKDNPSYKKYLKAVPKEERGADDPVTPNIFQRIGKRQLDKQIKYWRQLLHQWDYVELSDDETFDAKEEKEEEMNMWENDDDDDDSSVEFS